MADVTVSYKGNDILEMSDSGNATLKTGGKYCEDDVTVEYVKPSGGEDVLEKLLTNTLDNYSFYGTKATLGRKFENVKNIGEIRFPNLTGYQSGYCFSSCSATVLFFPKTACLGDFAPNCNKLKHLVIGSIGNSDNFRIVNGRGSSLISVDLVGISNAVSFGGNNTFKNCTTLDTLIIRSTSVATLGNILSLTDNTPFASGGAGGTIYIPKALYDHLGDGTDLDYKSATNWSTLDGYGTITWAQIEGSYYETHYADGTVIE